MSRRTWRLRIRGSAPACGAPGRACRIRRLEDFRAEIRLLPFDRLLSAISIPADHPDLAECRRRGWWSFCPGTGTGWRPCAADHPEASEDLNRLAYCRQTGTDGFYKDEHFNPWIKVN